MILLNLGINQMYLTISELNTINNPIYYIDFIDETVKDTKRVTITDTSLYANRYNQFQIEVTGTYSYENLEQSIVYLNEGKHIYNVWTSAGADSIEPEQLCETGIAKVNWDGYEVTPYSDNIALSTTFSSYSDRMLN